MAPGFVNDPVNDAWAAKFSKPNGTLETSQEGCLAFVPAGLLPSIAHDRALVRLLAEAERRVGELKGKCSRLENPHILMRAHLKREAVLSCRIEGTIASLDDLNRHEAFGISARDAGDRLAEVLNCVSALDESLEKIRRPDQKLDLEILRNAHRILMHGVGHDKTPGLFRRRQNWIARGRAGRESVVYAPPPPEKIAGLLRDLEGFLQTDGLTASPLIQCAIAHYQFESIHPFLDGNGRIGRLLVTLLLSKGVMPEPVLYLSSFFERHRAEYYQGLLRVSQKGKWGDWIKFFLLAIATQAGEALASIDKLLYIQDKYAALLRDRNAASNATRLVEGLFANPYTTIPRAQKSLNVTYPTAKRAVTALLEAGILAEAGAYGGRRTFVAPEIKEASE